MHARLYDYARMYARIAPQCHIYFQLSRSRKLLEMVKSWRGQNSNLMIIDANICSDVYPVRKAIQISSIEHEM